LHSGIYLEKNMHKPIKILRLIARLNIGGPAIHTLILTERLQSPEYESFLVTGAPESGEGDMSYIAEGRHIPRIMLPSMRRSLHLWRDAYAGWKIFQMIWQKRPDIVHTHTAKAGALGRIAAFIYNGLARVRSRFSGRPVSLCRTIHTFHGHVLEGYFGGLRTRLFIFIERYLARKTDRLIGVGSAVRDDLLNLGIGHASQWRVVTLDVCIGVVGRLVPIKNHKFLLQGIQHALAFIEKARIRFEIVGDGPLRGKLEEEAQALGLNGHARFTGWRQELTNVYNHLDMTCLTSLNEGTPVSIIESLASGRPVIATDVGGVRDLMGLLQKDHGVFREMAHGVLIDSGDVKGFKAALEYLALHPGLRQEMGHAGRNFVKEKYTDDRLVANIKTLYKEVLT
jgi:glycosyltransferase involved in cell wall biosynthesis